MSRMKVCALTNISREAVQARRLTDHAALRWHTGNIGEISKKLFPHIDLLSI
jgi:hypothetical protein